jgi:hypothetical protein
MVPASPKLACVMHTHHWLGWLAVNLALLWLGVEMSLPPDESGAMAAFDDAYLVPPEFQGATVRDSHPVPGPQPRYGYDAGTGDVHVMYARPTAHAYARPTARATQ